MGSVITNVDEDSTAESTPADVAVLYSWANVRGAKYRDYSASRREYRAQARYQAAKVLLERELRAQAEAEAAATKAEREAFAAEAVARSQDERANWARRLESMRQAEAAANIAAAERVEVARRAEAAAHAAIVALREEREIAEAHASAERQAMIYTEAEQRRRSLAGPQPHLPLGAPVSALAEESAADPDARAEFRPENDHLELGDEPPIFRTPDRRFGVLATLENEAESFPAGPAWLFPSGPSEQEQRPSPIKPTFEVEAQQGDTLQEWRERVAARWFALKGLFEQARPNPQVQSLRYRVATSSTIALFSIAGGVGKTSMAATLARALAAAGEDVLLADTTFHGLLPFYFGAGDVRRGAVQTMVPRSGDDVGPVSILCCGVEGASTDEAQRKLLADEILRAAAGRHRVLLDLASGASGLLPMLAAMHSRVLVPITPDMNSVISVQAVERLFREVRKSEERVILPVYVLNQFDDKQALHLDVREVFRRNLGERLLPVVIRRSPAVSEALAEGMTVLEYAPASPVARDYRDLVGWLMKHSPAVSAQVVDSDRSGR